MSTFFISEQESQQAEIDAALAPPVAPRQGQRVIDLEGLPLSEEITAFGRGGVAASYQFHDVLMDTAARGSRLLGQEEWARMIERREDERQARLARYRPDPETTTQASNIIASVTELGVLASVPGGPAVRVATPGLVTGLAARERFIREGVSPQAATTAAGIEGVGMSALVAAPIAVPGSIVVRALSGAGINAASGIGMRASVGGYLSSQGYDEQAEAYQWADSTAIATDAILGMAFGAFFGHGAPIRTRERVNEQTGETETVESRPVTALDWFNDARQAAIDENFAEAYALALIAHDLGHPEAPALVQTLEEDASPSELDQGRALASEYAAAELGRSLAHSELADAALIQQDALHREINTAPGIPADSSARRAHSEALSMAEEQAARDEEIDVVSTRVDEEEFIPRDPIEDAELDAIMRQELEDSGLSERVAEVEARLRAAEEEAISRGIDPGAMFSFGPRRDEVMGPRAFVKNALRNEGWRAEVDEQGVSVADIAARDGVHVGIVYRALNQARALPENVRSNLHEEINKVSRELENERGTKANDYSRQAVARLLEHAETVARANGGRLPHGYSGALADASGYAVHSVESMMSLARKGKYGADYQARANAIGKGVTGAKPTNRQVIGALMDQGLSIPQITQRLNGIRQDMGLEPTTENTVGATMSQIRKARREGDVRFSRTDRTGFSSPEELQYRAELMFGASWEALSRAGYAHIVQSSADVPGGLTGIPRGVKAVHLRETGESYFIANNIRPDELKGLILHEIGVHHGMEAMLGKRGWNTILRQVDRMVEAENPAAMEARSYVESRYREADVGAETVAYIVEFHADHPLTLSILARVRQWLVKTFGSTFGLRLTVDDIRALALASLRRVAEQARRESQPVTPLFVARPSRAETGAVMASAREQGYQGQDTGEAREWLEARAKGLPMDEASRIQRAREQGFDVDTPLYHGTDKQFDAFIPGYEGGTALTPDAALAAQFSDGEGQRILPTYARGRLMTYDASGAHYNNVDLEAVTRQARTQGYDGVRVQNMKDAPGSQSEQVFVFDPRNIRSRFAAFDPARSGESDLLASFGDDGQNRSDLIGVSNGEARADPIESPDYQARISALRGEGRGRDGGSAEGVPGGQAGERGGLGALKDVLAVSGVHFTPKRIDGFGDYRATIDTPIETPADAALRAPKQGGPTTIYFDWIDGSNPKEKRLPGLHIRFSRVNDAAKGQGVGVWFYRQMIDWADRQGLPTYSDFSISQDAQPIYAALERRGYKVEQINRARRDDEGAMVNQDFKPIFRITRTGAEEAYDAAPLPRNDYQLDGDPTLRERQETLDARRAAEEAHAKLPPEEQALADNPGMMFSHGVRRTERDASDYPLSARDLYDAAKTEEKVAREMGGAIDAAARCGARYAGQGFARGASFLTLNAGAKASAQAMMGQALGLTTAVPVGILATPMLARNASLLSPENDYLRNVADPAQYEHGKGIPFSEAASSDEDFVERPDPAMSMGDVLDLPAGQAPGRTPGRGKAPPAPADFKVDE